MKILFLGVSSFTGYHFVKKLSEDKKNRISCTLTKDINSYRSIRYERLKIIKKIKNIKLIKKVKFGDKKFIKLLSKNNFDIICFHHALTKNYNSNSKFNLSKSIAENTKNIESVLKILNKKTKILVSNTIFQKIPSKNYKAVNKYGFSKSITYEKIMLFCKKYNLQYKSIYIANPWGPLEEKKLNYYLISNWIKNKNITISHPRYIRDNIYIDKLTKEYVKIVYSKSKKLIISRQDIAQLIKSLLKLLKLNLKDFSTKK